MRVKLKFGKSPKLTFGKSPKSDVQTVCAECKSPIAPDATSCGACHAPIVRRYCPKCSRLVPENTQLCPYCGASSKTKPRDTARLPNVAIFTILGIAAAFFLLGGIFPSEKETKKIDPPPAVQLADRKSQVAPTHMTVLRDAAAGTLQIAGGQQPVIRSDEEGTKLNLQAYELIQQKNYQQAEPLLRRAVQSFTPGTSSVAYKYSLYNLGHVLRRIGRAKEAIPYLEQCVKLDPQWSKAQTELAVAKSQAQPVTVPQVSSL